MFLLPKNSKSWDFDREWTEPLFSPPSVYLKQASHKGNAHLTVKRIKSPYDLDKEEKFSVTLQFGNGDEHYMTGIAIFAAINEHDAIKAAEEAAIVAKLAKRDK
jgi:hypothetical protein